MRVLLAPDKFKGTLTAPEAAAAMERGLGPGVEADRCPVADGGDGTLDVLLEALEGERRRVEVTGPLGEPVRADLGLLADGRTAVVEVAQASGLRLVAEAELDPEEATSAGAGELIAAALESGARRVLVACGGSASSDGGMGALERFNPAGADLVVLCDTLLPFEEATRFAPQKGAGPAAVRRIAERLGRLAHQLPRDPRGMPGGAAAGGLAGGLWAHGAELVPGARFVLDSIGFNQRMAAAAFVLTGEGRLDPTTLTGKAPGEVATRCRQAGVPCHAIVGRRELGPFDVRLLALDSIQEAGDPDAIARAAGEIRRRFEPQE